LLDALSAAAEEITRDLAPGSVEVRLRGRDPDFIVTSPAEELLAERPESSLKQALAGAVEVTMGVRPPASADADDGGRSRITLRLPEHIKPRIDDAASRAGLSVNAWLVRAVSAALEVDEQAAPGQSEGRQFGRRYTGWVR
jgi:hypothetical protein